LESLSIIPAIRQLSRFSSEIRQASYNVVLSNVALKRRHCLINVSFVRV
jgi:hypothetical protein